MEENKQKFALWAYPDTLEAVEKQYRQDNCRSKSEFIEKAVHFYVGYICSADKSDYLPHIVVSTMQGTMDAFEDRIAGLLFKMAVELSMLLHVTAATNEIDEETLSRLRGMCVAEVKRLRGSVRMEDAVKYQNGDEARYTRSRSRASDLHAHQSGECCLFSPHPRQRTDILAAGNAGDVQHP